MIQQQNRPESSTDEEHTIHASNIHGAFFERKCQDVVHNAKNWQIQDTNYPVTYGGANSNLDIWADSGRTWASTRAVLLIECKKNNHGFIDWIFFRQPRHRPSASYIQMIQLRQNMNETSIWEIRRELRPLKHDLIIADEARETKGDYLKIRNQQDRTKTSNMAITDAATQISIATQALIEQEYNVIEDARNNHREFLSYFQHFFLPTIVTTAKLFTCEFQDADVNLTTGEIPLDKVKLVPCPFLIYDYPIPPALQTLPKAMNLSYTRDTLKQLARMPIFVVQSEAFPMFLERLTLPERHEGSFGDNAWYELELKPGETEAI